MKKLKYTTNQVRYCGTTYTVHNVPTDMTEQEVVEACGVTYGWWVNRYERYGNTVRFNVNYD